jgi:inorganic pyrophosphatase
MRAVVETPKWSFVKYRLDGGRFVRDFVSPLPTLFNYGFVVGERAPDGLPRDALVLGPRLRQGQEPNYAIAGYLKFIDRGKEDDKVVLSKNGKISSADRLKIHVFFVFYSIFKRLWYALGGVKPSSCVYLGIIANKLQ